jgi:aspartate ammonia-lyase
MLPNYFSELHTFSNQVSIEQAGKEMKSLLKARVHSNKNMSNIAGFGITKMIDALPLMLRNFEVFKTILDLIQAMSEHLATEYTSIVKPISLNTTEEFVFLPADKDKIQALLKQFVGYFTEMYVYCAIYNNSELQENFDKYL